MVLIIVSYIYTVYRRKEISQVIAHCSTRLAAHRMTIPFILVPPAF